MMKKSVFVILSLGIVALFGATVNVWNMEMDASASFCQESKDPSQADPACSPKPRGECNKDLAGEHKDFKCVEK